MVFKQTLLWASLILSAVLLVAPFRIATAESLDAGNGSEVQVSQDNILGTKPETDVTIPADIEAKSLLLRMWGSEPAVADPSTPQDFLRDTIALGKDLQAKVMPQLEKLASKFPDITINVQEFRETISQVVASISIIQETVLGNIRDKGRDVSFNEVKEELDGALQLTLDGMSDQFPHPDQALTRTERNEMIYELLSRGEDVLIQVAMKYSTNDDESTDDDESYESYLRRLFKTFKTNFARLIILILDFMEQHPVITEYLIISIIGMFIPHLWILRLFGFGPMGPIKGGIAAFIQRLFYGAAIPKGSVFSFLQRMAMGPITPVVKAIVGTAGTWVFRGVKYMFG